jgi:hypothetical protein
MDSKIVKILRAEQKKHADTALRLGNALEALGHAKSSGTGKRK